MKRRIFYIFCGVLIFLILINVWININTTKIQSVPKSKNAPSQVITDVQNTFSDHATQLPLAPEQKSVTAIIKSAPKETPDLLQQSEENRRSEGRANSLANGSVDSQGETENAVNGSGSGITKIYNNDPSGRVFSKKTETVKNSADIFMNEKQNRTYTGGTNKIENKQPNASGVIMW